MGVDCINKGGYRRRKKTIKLFPLPLLWSVVIVVVNSGGCESGSSSMVVVASMSDLSCYGDNSGGRSNKGSVSDNFKGCGGGSGEGVNVKMERKYLAHVKTLNKSVLAWIQKHVVDWPTCILTPTLRITRSTSNASTSGLASFRAATTKTANREQLPPPTINDQRR